MKVLKDYILIKEPLNTEKKSETGIFLGEDAIDFSRPVTNEVILVGSDVKEVKVGDTVMYMPKQGIHMKQDDCTWRFLKEENIIAVM
jgi:chaperonin GroES